MKDFWLANATLDLVVPQVRAHAVPYQQLECAATLRRRVGDVLVDDG
jgi:hypothetical protein